MLSNQHAPSSGAILPCSELSDGRRWELAQRCHTYLHRLIDAGVDLELAADVSQILVYRPLPWAISDQALVRRAFEQVIKGMETPSCPEP